MAENERRKVTAIIPSEAVMSVSTGEVKELSKKDLERFEKLREKLILKAFDWDKNEYKTYLEEFQKLLKKTDNGTKSKSDMLDDARNVAVGSQKNVEDTNKETAKKVIDLLTGSLGATLLAKLTAVVPFAGVVVSAILIAGIVKKHIDAQKLNNTKAEIDWQNYEKLLNDVMNDVEIFTNSIEKDKEMLIEKQKTMKKGDFNKFLDKYIAQKCTELGIKKANIKVEQSEREEGNIPLNIQLGGA